MSDENISAVSSKIPNPWPQNMEMWLTVIDSQFDIHGITQQQTKFHYVVGALTPDLADRLRHIICKPPSEKPYTALRKAIIKLTALTDRQRYMALMRDVELGDRSPSQFLQYLENLIGDSKFFDGFFRAFLGNFSRWCRQYLPLFRHLQRYANLLRSPTKSRNHIDGVSGVLNVPISALLWRCTLDDWHGMQHRVHCRTSFRRPSQAKRSFIRRMEAWMPGFASTCRSSKFFFRGKQAQQASVRLLIDRRPHGCCHQRAR